MHKRKLIRSTIVDMLKNSVTGVNVYDSRVFPLLKKNLPAVSVYAIEETSEKSKDEGVFTRRLRVVIAAYVNGHDPSEVKSNEVSVDDRLDELSTQIEGVFHHQYETLRNTVYRFNPVSTRIEVDGDAEWIFGMAFMEYEAIYHDTNL